MRMGLCAALIRMHPVTQRSAVGGLWLPCGHIRQPPGGGECRVPSAALTPVGPEPDDRLLVISQSAHKAGVKCGGLTQQGHVQPVAAAERLVTPHGVQC